MDYGLVEFALSSVTEDRSFLFNIEAQTFINAGVNLFNVIILAAVLAYLLYRPIRNVLHKRTERIQGELKQAEEDMLRAAELKLQYEQKMEEVQRERDEILSEARKLASEAGQRLLAESKKEAEAIRTRASANIEMEWERAESEMRTAVIEISAAMAEKFVTLAINKETHDRLFNETMADLEGMSWRD